MWKGHGDFIWRRISPLRRTRLPAFFGERSASSTYTLCKWGLSESGRFCENRIVTFAATEFPTFPLKRNAFRKNRLRRWETVANRQTDSNLFRHLLFETCLRTVVPVSVSGTTSLKFVVRGSNIPEGLERSHRRQGSWGRLPKTLRPSRVFLIRYE